MDRDYKKMRVIDLRDELRDRRLLLRGNKRALIMRLILDDMQKNDPNAFELKNILSRGLIEYHKIFPIVAPSTNFAQLKAIIRDGIIDANAALRIFVEYRNIHIEADDLDTMNDYNVCMTTQILVFMPMIDGLFSSNCNIRVIYNNDIILDEYMDVFRTTISDVKCKIIARNKITSTFALVYIHNDNQIILDSEQKILDSEQKMLADYGLVKYYMTFGIL